MHCHRPFDATIAEQTAFGVPSLTIARNPGVPCPENRTERSSSTTPAKEVGATGMRTNSLTVVKYVSLKSCEV